MRRGDAAQDRRLPPHDGAARVPLEPDAGLRNHRECFAGVGRSRRRTARSLGADALMQTVAEAAGVLPRSRRPVPQSERVQSRQPVRPVLPFRFPERVRIVREPAAGLDDRRKALTQDGDQGGIELDPRPGLDQRAGLLVRLGPAPGSVGGQGLEGVRHREHPSRQRNLFAFKPVGIPRSVPALVMVADGRQHRVREVDVRQDVRGHRRVGLDLLEFHLGELPRLVQEMVGDGQLPDVVQERRGTHRLELLPRDPHAAGQLERVSLHAARVTLRVRILGVNRQRQGLDGRQVDLHQVVQAPQALGDMPLVGSVHDDGEQENRRDDDAGDQADLSDQQERQRRRGGPEQSGAGGHDRHEIEPSPRSAGLHVVSTGSVGRTTSSGGPADPVCGNPLGPRQPPSTGRGGLGRTDSCRIDPSSQRPCHAPAPTAVSLAHACKWMNVSGLAP